MSKIVLLSIKPRYADLIATGKKTVELRKRLPRNLKKGDIVILYVSSPAKEICGAIIVSEIHSATPKQIWSKFRRDTAVTYSEFYNYFLFSSIAYAIEIKSYFDFESTLSLKEIKKHNSSFVVPQSFRYMSYSELKRFQIKLPNISNL